MVEPGVQAVFLQFTSCHPQCYNGSFLLINESISEWPIYLFDSLINYKFKLSFWVFFFFQIKMEKNGLLTW